MSHEGHSAEGALGGQARNLKVIDPQRIYSSTELAQDLAVTEETLAHWAAIGLKRPDRKKLKMKYQPYFGDMVLEFMRNNLE